MTIRQSDRGGDRITPRAVELFKAMDARRDCACEVMTKRCPDCDEWWRLQSELHDELQLKPWQWPAVIDPDERDSGYPAESGGAEWHREGQALWRELERMAAA